MGCFAFSGGSSGPGKLSGTFPKRVIVIWNRLDYNIRRNILCRCRRTAGHKNTGGTRMGTFNVSLKTLTERVSLEVVYTPKELDQINVEIAEVNRPGLFLAGYYDYFDKQIGRAHV